MVPPWQWRLREEHPSRCTPQPCVSLTTSYPAQHPWVPLGPLWREGGATGPCSRWGCESGARRVNVNPEIGFLCLEVNINPPPTQPYRSIGWCSVGTSAVGAGTPGCLETGEVGGRNAPSSKQRGWNKTPNAKNREEEYQNKERSLATPGHPYTTARHPAKPGWHTREQ